MTIAPPHLVEKSYDRRHRVIHDINLKAQPSEYIVFVGLFGVYLQLQADKCALFNRACHAITRRLFVAIKMKTIS
ncbi:hypothetical protein [Chitinivorax sp. B]|uniref:hypothetical protein n=1 Tax=Chitinivorax sp. B TaxID=2502235 RepID=UPI0010F90AE8|nr:hypothetical protein [Chitinivorax sp. B]